MIRIRQPAVVLFVLGFLGVLSTLPMIPHLLALQPEKPPLPLWLIQVISVAESAVLLALMVWLGAVFAKRVGLGSPVIEAVCQSGSVYAVIKPQIIPAVIGGVICGAFLLLFFAEAAAFLPAEFIAAGENLALPWYTKLLYGGITEEVLVRWGVMSFLVWLFYRATQKTTAPVRAHNYVLAIVVSALVFAAAHLPIALTLSPEPTVPLFLYIIFGNATFGFVAGYLFWKRGLECAMVAHMVAHLTIIAGTAVV
jgi:hypothetical protein